MPYENAPGSVVEQYMLCLQICMQMWPLLYDARYVYSNCNFSCTKYGIDCIKYFGTYGTGRMFDPGGKFERMDDAVCIDVAKNEVF